MSFNIVNIIVFLLVILSLAALAPFIITLLYPNMSYGSTAIGRIQQYLNHTIHFGYITWFSYAALMFYFIYLSSKVKKLYKRIGLIFLFLFLIYLPILPILLLFNVILSFTYENPPFLQNHHSIFPESIALEKNAETIIGEYTSYVQTHKPECIRKTNPGFKIENTEDETKCWRSVYLKKKGMIEEEMKLFFPNTIHLLQSHQIHNAFFSILDPGVEIPIHDGYYKGYLRYHMGVVIPNNHSKENKAYIVCGGQKYIWNEGEGVLFDDLYPHYVKNPSNKTRVVLYLDIIRNSDNPFVNGLNNIGIHLIETSLILNYFMKNQHNQQKL
jgi:hypothetical protein